MKKMMRVLWGLAFVAVASFSGKVFAEQAAQTVNSAGASVEAEKALEVNLESVSEDEAPIDEELKDEEVVDADA